MNKNLSERVADWYSRYFPDAFIFALLLTLLSILAAIFFTDSSTFSVLGYWFNGVPDLFLFAFQLIITYAAALVLVDTPIMKSLISKMAGLVKSPSVAYVSTSIIGALTSFLGWYIGPVITSLYARSIGQNVDGVDYRLLSAVAYSSFIISLTGISGTIPLFVATEGELTDMLGGLYSLKETTFSLLNMVTAFAIVAVTTIIFYIIGRNKKDIVTFHDLAIENEMAAALAEEEKNNEVKNYTTFAEKINHFRPIIFITGILGLVYLVYFLGQTGLDGLNLNTVAFIAIILGFLVHRNPTTYVESFSKNMNATSSIALQFPLYGGIAAILFGSGLTDTLIEWIVNVSNDVTFPVLTFLMTGFINLFIPSAGGQFAATAPFFVPAGIELGVEIPRTIMAITFGDIWTNLIQPFWALLYFPILSLGTRLTVRDFMGYCLPILAAVGVIWIVGLLFLPI